MPSGCGGVCACRALPDWRPGATLVVHSATGHTVRLVAEAAARLGAEVRVDGPLCHVTGDDLDEVLALLATELSSPELGEARAVLTPIDAATDLLRVGLAAVPLAELVARVRYRDLATLVAEPWQEVSAARELGVDLAQGWHFGRPERAMVAVDGQPRTEP